MKKTIKKILLYGAATFLFLVFVLAVHIYFVYRPAPDANTRVMARIDIKQRLTQDEANKIASWMYHQKGVDHVLVNPQTNIVIFTFYPVKTSGNKIVSDFKSNFSVKAERIIANEANLKSSCPVAATSYTYKFYKLITKII
jgi:hypothetical protein